MPSTYRPGHRPAFAALASLLCALPGWSHPAAEPGPEVAVLFPVPGGVKAPPPVAVPGVVPVSAVKKMTWRCVGPANMGGRITAIAVVESDPSTYYVATASGGLLKTTNNGVTFAHLFDREATVSIGDVAVAPSEPSTVWVGTGENNPRNSVSYGDGVYKSTDGGKTWANVGLKQSFQIGRVVVHPKDANTVYVGALGRLYGPNEERGVFKTADGGKSWKKILYVDDRTGAIDLSLDPFNPDALLVGMWERKRDGFDGSYGDAKDWPSADQYGPEITYGPGGGLFRSTDAGKTWTKLTDAKLKNGLPTVKTGRIGVDFSRKTKGLVYAVIDTENVGKGRPPLTVYLGITSDTAKGGGVKIESVVEDGSLGKAGVKDGDTIVAIGGEKLPDYDTLIDVMSRKKPDDVVKFTVKRDEKELTLDVKLVARQTSDRPTGPPSLGIQLGNGLVVTGLTPDGAASKAGVKTGDTIVSVAGAKVADNMELAAARAKFKAGEKVKLGVTRDGKPLELELTLGAAAKLAAPPLRPFQLQPVVGGQQPNVQKDQGKDGFQTGGVYVSKDGGVTWSRVNSLNPRPFYYCQVRCDPNDEKAVYVLGDLQLWRSTDGGAKFASSPVGGVHPDHHALWIDPRDSRHMILGGDGGFYSTYDRGAVWDHHNNFAIGQFYHVAVDNKRPYNVYGGLQDNGCWGGPSQVLRGTGPTNDDWLFLNGGDGFVMRIDAADAEVVYAESQNGAMNWRNLKTGESRGIGRGPVKQGEPLRYNWNTPFILSAHNPNIFYTGAQYVFRSLFRGADLKPISPDLTLSKKGTISAVAESPKSADVLWAGTDDGNLWVTRDGGGKWESVLDKLKAAGLPGPRWVSSIEPSRVAEGRCYVCLDAHRSDDDKPYLFVTEDHGATWKPLTANLPAFGSTRVLREDITNPNVLYCGTEFGIWVSLNRGAAWANLNNNLPTVAVHEIAQPTTASDLVVGTHGRSVWILDASSIRQMTPRKETVGKEEKTIDPLAEPVTLFAPPTATRWKLEAGRESPYSKDARKFYGTNPPLGAAFEYLVTKPGKAASLKVTDALGTTVKEFRTAPADAGFHRLQWSLSGPKGSIVPSGSYKVTLTVDGKDYVRALTVENDPKADPKAVISFEVKRRRFEEKQEEFDRDLEERESLPRINTD